jgi:hypothetical protein
MNLYLRISIAIVITSLLLCGNAFAKPDNDAPPIEVDVNVVNTPLDVNVTNDENNLMSVKVQERVVIPFQARQASALDSISAGHTTGLNASLPNDEVPVGYRAVLTHASLKVCHDDNYNYPSGTTWNMSITIMVTTMGTSCLCEIK